MNEIHSSIISLEDLQKITNKISKLNFWDISEQISSHCNSHDNIIEYLLEIPIYDTNSVILTQLTPIPMFIDNRMNMLNSNKVFIMQMNNKLYNINKCISNKEKYFCHSNFIEINNCLRNIIKIQDNKECMNHSIHDSFIVNKIENSNMIVIASNKKQNVNIKCNDYEKHKLIKGVYKFITKNNCQINDYHLENSVINNKEIIFENIDFKIRNNRLTNKNVTLKQIENLDIKIKEHPKIEHINTPDSVSHPIINTCIIVTIIVIIIILLLIYRTKFILCKKPRSSSTIELKEINKTDTALF